MLALEGRQLLATFPVTSTADDGSTGTLRWAVAQADVATSPSTIAFSLGGGAHTITLSGAQLDLGNNSASITIDGPGAGLLSISGNEASRVFQVDGGVTASISGLTISGGSAGPFGSGGGVSNQGTVTLTDCTLSGNTAVGEYGGGLVNDATAKLVRCTISGNSAGSGGGLANNGAMMTLTDCTIVSNTARFGGGDGGSGGGVAIEGGTAMLTDCTISDNTAGTGGGLANFAWASLIDCTISGNSAVVVAGASTTGGGGLFNQDTLRLTNCTVVGNTAPIAGGLDNLGAAGLIGTIVAGNSVTGGPASDITGTVIGMYNLIGTGGSGGLRASDNNLLDVANPGLSPVGNYGGTTQTYAILPGSPAISAGTQAYDSQNNPITTDQRGLPLDSPTPDIGAFQSQGFVLAPLAGSTPQSTPTGAAFTNPLALSVTAHNSSEPVAGGIVTYTPPAAGASANLTNTTAVIGQNGVALVGATANSAAGSYTVAASTAGAAIPARFSLSNLGKLIGLSFSGLSNPSTTYGASATFTGTLSSGTQTPAGQSVQVTVGSLSQSATIGSSGTFSATLSNVNLEVAGSPYLVTFSYTSDGTFASATATVTLTVAKASPILSVSDSGGTFNGSTFPAVVTIAGVVPGLDNTPGSELEGIGPTVAYYAGTYTNVSQLIGATPLPAAPSGAGSYTVVARFPGSADYVPVQALANFTVAQATPMVTVNDAGGTYNGTAYTAAAGVTGVSGASGSTLESIGLTISYYAGTYTTAGQLARLTPLPGGPSTAGAYTVQAKFAGSADYTGGTALANFTISRATPMVTWNPPGSIVYGTPLSVTQLDASANVPGSFNYVPGAGAVLDAGAGQGLSVIFTPNDLIDYTTATVTTLITVTQARPILSLTVSGGIFDGSPFPASVTIAGSGRDGTPAASLQQVYPVLNYYIGADLSGPSLGSVPPVHPGTYTVVATFPGSLDYSLTRSGAITFVIGKGNPVIALASSCGSAVFGQTVTFVATVTAIAAGTGGSVTFYDGTVPLGTTLVNASGQAMLATSSLAAGSHSITAAYGGNADLHSATSGVLAESVGKAATQVALVLQPIFKKKQLVSVEFKTQVQPIAPGGGVPTGALTFEILAKSRKKVTVKVIGAAALGSGSATLALKPKSVLNKSIAILYGGDANFTSSTATSAVLTQGALKRLARPMAALQSRGHTRIKTAVTAGRD
jgi:hypothetical protein